MLLTSLRRTIASPVFTSKPAATTLRNFSITANRMGVTKTTISKGNEADFPKAGDTVSMHYEGFLYENGQKAKEYVVPVVLHGLEQEELTIHRFDSSRKRGSPFVTEIGVGRVIRGMTFPFAH